MVKDEPKVYVRYRGKEIEIPRKVLEYVVTEHSCDDFYDSIDMYRIDYHYRVEIDLLRGSDPRSTINSLVEECLRDCLHAYKEIHNISMNLPIYFAENFCEDIKEAENKIKEYVINYGIAADKLLGVKEYEEYAKRKIEEEIKAIETI